MIYVPFHPRNNILKFTRLIRQHSIYIFTSELPPLCTKATIDKVGPLRSKSLTSPTTVRHEKLVPPVKHVPGCSPANLGENSISNDWDAVREGDFCGRCKSVKICSR